MFAYISPFKNQRELVNHTQYRLCPLSKTDLEEGASVDLNRNTCRVSAATCLEQWSSSRAGFKWEIGLKCFKSSEKPGRRRRRSEGMWTDSRSVQELSDPQTETCKKCWVSGLCLVFSTFYIYIYFTTLWIYIQLPVYKVQLADKLAPECALLKKWHDSEYPGKLFYALYRFFSPQWR